MLAGSIQGILRNYVLPHAQEKARCGGTKRASEVIYK
jgi:hypothetical protein